MSYELKIERVKDIVEQHNEEIKEEGVNFISFLEKLKKMGGTSEDALKAISWEDLQECGLPKIIARRVAHLFRQDSNSAEHNYISINKLYSMSIEQIIEKYDPYGEDGPISHRLKEISGDNPFIIFDNNGKVLIEPSASLLKEIKSGLSPVETYFVDGKPFDVYRIGESPSVYVDENPLYPGRELRSNEVCDKTGKSWKGVPLKIRQIIYISIKITKEFKIDLISDAYTILNRIVDSTDFGSKYIENCFPQSVKKYNELCKIGGLPLLKVKLGKKLVNIEKNNPKIY
jgi:hypothetical protein